MSGNLSIGLLGAKEARLVLEALRNSTLVRSLDSERLRAAHRSSSHRSSSHGCPHRSGSHRRHGLAGHGLRRIGTRRILAGHGLTRHGLTRHGLRRISTRRILAGHGLTRHGLTRHGLRRISTGHGLAGHRSTHRHGSTHGHGTHRSAHGHGRNVEGTHDQMETATRDSGLGRLSRSDLLGILLLSLVGLLALLVESDPCIKRHATGRETKHADEAVSNDIIGTEAIPIVDDETDTISGRVGDGDNLGFTPDRVQSFLDSLGLLTLSGSADLKIGIRLAIKICRRQTSGLNNSDFKAWHSLNNNNKKFGIYNERNTCK